MMPGRAPIPLEGYGLPDNIWLNGLAGGNNMYTQNGITALAGGGQAGAPTVGAPNAQGIEANLIEVDTVATSADSIQLPVAVAGKYMLIRNAGAASMRVFASPNTNRATGALDSINGGTNATGVDVNFNHGAIAFCAKNGNWTLLVV